MLLATDDRRHILGPQDRESLLYIICLPDQNLGAFAYAWVNGAGKAGRLMTVYGANGPKPVIWDMVDGIDVSPEMNFDDWVIAGLKISQGELLQEADVSFEHGGVSFEMSFKATNPAFSYADHPAGCPAFLAENRYEQSGLTVGRLKLPDREIAFSGTAHRDHSWGRRSWGEPKSYQWYIGQAGADLSFNVIVVHLPEKRQVVGYVARAGVNYAVLDVEAAPELDADLRVTRLKTVFIDEQGGRMELIGERAAMMEFDWAGGQCIYVETTLACTIDGVPAVGHAEQMFSRSVRAELLGNPAAQESPLVK